MNKRNDEPDDAKKCGDREEEDHVELPVVDAHFELGKKNARETVYRPYVA